MWRSVSARAVVVLAWALIGCGDAQSNGSRPALPPGECAAAACGAISSVDESGLAEPAARVGFIEVEPLASVRPGGGAPRESTGARLFYRFVPANEGAKDAPVLVFFNGGPSYTSMLLMSFGTGPTSLDVA